MARSMRFCCAKRTRLRWRCCSETWILRRQWHGRDSREMHHWNREMRACQPLRDARLERCADHEPPGAKAIVAAAATPSRVVARATRSGRGNAFGLMIHGFLPYGKWKKTGFCLRVGVLPKSTADWRRENRHVVSRRGKVTGRSRAAKVAQNVCHQTPSVLKYLSPQFAFGSIL